MTTDELKKKYADAETEIRDIYTNTKAVTVTTYQSRTQSKIDNVLADLRTFTTEYCDEEIENIYQDSLEQLELDLYEEYGLEEDWHIDRVAETNTIQEVREDTESKLMFAIIAAGMCLSGYNATARMSFGDNAEAYKELMLMQIANGGIQGNSYFREGEIVHGSLSAYANVVLQGAETETANSAVMDTMLANGWDLVKVSYHWGACPLCVPYEDRVYSISGTSEDFPYLYDTPWNDAYQNFHPNCRHYLKPFFPQSLSEDELQKMIDYSNRSFEVGGEGWTKQQTAEARRNLKAYNEGQKRKAEIYGAKKQYERYKAALGDKAPKSFSGFWRIKQANGEAYANLMSDYRNRAPI